MNESICLHIQDRESGPIRVIELPWSSVRIGSAAHCEVRLLDQDLPDEICRLQRRGQLWRLLPSADPSPITLAGRRLVGSSILSFDIPFRVGQHCFTLRQDRTVEPDWEIYAGPKSRWLDPSSSQTIVVEESNENHSQNVNDARVRIPIESARPAILNPPIPERRVFAVQSSRGQWESQWRVFSARIEARGEKSRKRPDIKYHAYESIRRTVSYPDFRNPLNRLSAKASLEQTADLALVRPPLSIHTREDARVRRAWRDDANDLVTDFTLSKQISEIGDSHAHALTNRQESSDLGKIASTQIGNVVFELRPVDGKLIPFVSSRKPDSRPKVIPEEGKPELAGTKVNDLSSCKRKINERSDISSASDSTQRQNNGIGFQDQAIETMESNVESESPKKNKHALALSTEAEWPLVKDILSPHGGAPLNCSLRDGSDNSKKKKLKANSTPTLAKAPSYWRLPVWLAGPAVAAVIVSMGLLGCAFSWCWAYDAYVASIVTDHLISGDRELRHSRLVDSVVPPRDSWMVSTAGHLAQWAIFLSLFGRENDRSTAVTADILKQALTVSPINATARLALAQLRSVENAKDVPIESLGLSRDGISLAFTARRLLAFGQKQAALKLYTLALSVTIRGEQYDCAVPGFSEDPSAWFLLPRERQVRDIVVDLVSRDAWMFHEWSSALPENPIVLITTVRLLRERGRSEAQTVFARLINSKLLGNSSGNARAIILAARAEAFALQSHWREADQLYRLAIDLIDDPIIARSWWFNLADISYRSNNEVERQAALKASSAVAVSDDITVRANEIRRVTLTRTNGVKAN